MSNLKSHASDAPSSVRASSNKPSTQKRILDTAERLFAKEGFEQTSLRQITQEADVNLASVNYHFGSKKALIQAVVARYMDVFMPALDEELRGLDDESALTTLQVFEAFKLPLFSLNGIHKRGTERFLRLLGFAYSETQGHLRRYTQSAFGNVLQHLLSLLHRANPELSDEEMFWRLHFVLGATVFAQVSGQALIEIARAEFNYEVNIKTVIEHLIVFIAGGLERP
ncbi:TetR/AcrR family transcriptional regulator [Idiomarina baltica]|uniref:TetR/AcrR family transcriptional regulator n=1 Tax=Idiomarina baltica TaxID=190892 RepID=UPI002353A258|nr:TetR/AcrR family transcriptional regulator [Idiomarina baltica]|tara:strand:- start:2322 stop:2999 length:678 start_codon:yes stop_codon:yes gene_type:complete